jgi:DNA-binding MarR family transcriptional regulator
MMVKRAPLSNDALETSKLLVEFLHVVQSTGGAAASTHGVDGPGKGQQISPHAIRAVIHLYQHGERTIGELAAGLGISMGWASRVVTELGQSGLAERVVDPNDRRVVRVSLAAPALKIVEQAYRWRGDAIERALAGFGAGERAAVQRFLRNAIAEFGTARP